MGTTLEVVVPVFTIVLLGFGLGRIGIFSGATSEGLTRFMFYVAVPAMLFRTLASTALPSTVPWSYILAFYGSSFTLFLIGAVCARFGFRWSKRDQGIAAISASYSNMVMLGLPLILAAYGDAGALPLFILLALQSTLMFPATTWAIEVYGGEPSADGPGSVATLVKLLANPVILSLLLGLGANLLSIEIAGFPARVLETIAAAAPACALTALGVGLAQYEVRGEFGEAVSLVLLKGLVHPALVFVACRMLAVDWLWTQVAVLLAAMPIGINAFIFAQAYGTRVAAVSKAIVISTLFSALSVSLLLRLFLP